MRLLQWFYKALFVATSVLIGNWLGAQLRTGLTGQPTAGLHFRHITRNGLQMENYPVMTKFYPALLYSLTGKPRWLYGFLAGVFTGVVVDDSYEAAALDWFADLLGLEGDAPILD